MRPALLAACLALPLLAGGCSEPSTGPPTPVPVVTDTAPLGEGIKTLAYALLGASVVFTVGRVLR
jgi:hypothetical protein